MNETSFNFSTIQYSSHKAGHCFQTTWGWKIIPRPGQWHYITRQFRWWVCVCWALCVAQPIGFKSHFIFHEKHSDESSIRWITIYLFLRPHPGSCPRSFGWDPGTLWCLSLMSKSREPWREHSSRGSRRFDLRLWEEGKRKLMKECSLNANPITRIQLCGDQKTIWT